MGGVHVGSTSERRTAASLLATVLKKAPILLAVWHFVARKQKRSLGNRSVLNCAQEPGRWEVPTLQTIRRVGTAHRFAPVSAAFA